MYMATFKVKLGLSIGQASSGLSLNQTQLDWVEWLDFGPVFD